jgi:gliding motility-associated-like protein
LINDDPLAEVTPLETTTYTLTVSNGVCEDLVQQLTVTVQFDATVSIGNDITVCEAEGISGVTLTATSSEPGGTFEWQDQSTGPTYTGFPNDTTLFSVTYSNSCGESFDTISVNVIQSVGVMIEIIDPDPNLVDTIYEGETLTLTATPEVSLTGATYLWSTGQTGQTITTEAAFPPIQYSVTVTTSDGCTYESFLTVNTYELKYGIPNVFTPNGDTENDYFNVFSNAPLTITEFKVFNRWGAIVYDNENPAQGWDGTFKNENAPSDVYIYMITIELPSGVKNEKGDLTLMR